MSYSRKFNCANVPISNVLMWKFANVLITLKIVCTRTYHKNYFHISTLKIRTSFRGQEWIRTTEVVDSGFTVRPIWPLWNLPELVEGLKSWYVEWLNSINISTFQPFNFFPLSPEPLAGIEPATYWLQISCSTCWAKAAISTNYTLIL